MPELPASNRSASIQSTIHTFIKERLDSKLDKLADDDPKRAELIAQYQPAAWLEDAARRVRQLQIVTHALKPINPNARGTNLYVPSCQFPAHTDLSSQVLGDNSESDVVGNAGALDVYKFLKLKIDDRSLLDALLDEDADALHALDTDEEKSRQLRDAFVSIFESNESQPSSHTLAKQIYWLVDDDPADDAAYHLLAPLHPTSLAHAIYTTIQEDRFGQINQAARQACYENSMHDGVLRDYPNLAIQKLGSTKPQTVSHLNNEHRGVNYLLPCMPPTWQSLPLRSLYKTPSFFDAIYANLPEVRKTLSSLLHFLKNDPRSTMETRDQRDAYIDGLIDELVDLAARYQNGWEPGWSLKPETELHEDECLWLDPYRAEFDEEFRHKWLQLDWPNRIGERFARWLNSKLEGQLPVGDIEFRQWKKELLLDETQAGWAQKLHRLCKALDTSSFMFIRDQQESNA